MKKSKIKPIKVTQKEFDETVIKKMEEFRQMNQGQGRGNGGVRIGG